MLNPLHLDGDALVLPDVESPFHHKEFVSRAVQEAVDMGVRNCVLAGDFMHFDSLSPWGANFVTKERNEIIDQLILSLGKSGLGKKAKKEIIEALEAIRSPESGDGLSTELDETRRLVKWLESKFDKIFYVLGNHEGRLVRSLQTDLDPKNILFLINADLSKWSIAPYYYMTINSGGQMFLVSHPKSTSPSTAEKLAAIHHMHTLVAHAHTFRLSFDPSSKYMALMMGCCVDESKLPYASQRQSANGVPHKLGAAIVANGKLYVIVDGDVIAR